MGFHWQLPIVKRMAHLGRTSLAWLWAVTTPLVLLCWLPWFELTKPWLTVHLSGLVYLLTLTGIGPSYFACRTQSPTWRKTLEGIRQLAVTLLQGTTRIALIYLGITFLAMFIIGWYAFAPLLSVLYLFEKDRPDIILFVKGHQQMVSRKKSLIVLWPVVPGFNFVTYPSIEVLDSSWEHVRIPNSSALISSQDYWLAEAHQARLTARLAAIEESRRKAQLAAEKARREHLGYDVLRFELDTTLSTFFSPQLENNYRILRQPLDSTQYGLARLDANNTLRLGTNELIAGDLRVVIAKFTGPGTYLLKPPPQAQVDTSFMQLRRYAGGKATTYSGLPTQPPRVEITRFDREHRVVEGTFSGRLLSPNGTAIELSNGMFALRFVSVFNND